MISKDNCGDSFQSYKPPKKTLSAEKIFDICGMQLSFSRLVYNRQEGMKKDSRDFSIFISHSIPAEKPTLTRLNHTISERIETPESVAGEECTKKTELRSIFSN